MANSEKYINMAQTNTSTLAYVVNNPAFFLSHRLELAKKAQQRGYRVVVFAPKSPEIMEISRHGFEVEELRLNRKSLNPFSELMTLFDLFIKIKKWRPHVIHGISVKPVIYSSLIGIFFPDSYFVHTITGLGFSFTRSGVVGAALRRLIGLLFKISFSKDNLKVIFQNYEDQKLFLERGWVKESKTVVIRGSGVDINKFQISPLPPGLTVILFPSRMVKDKGLFELVDACKRLYQQGEKFKLVLAGSIDSNSRAEISEQQINNWISLGFVEWLGFQSDMNKIYRSSHIVCLPSYREGLSLALLEAAACGRPIVTTDEPGCRDVVIPNASGLIVPAREVTPLKDALKTLLNSREKLEAMGLVGRTLVTENYSLDRVISATLELYPPSKTDFRKAV